MKRIENALGSVKAADGIREDKQRNQEKWFNVVVKELDDCARDYAKKLGSELNAIHNKAIYTLTFDESPPERLLALAIVTSAWLGWIFQEKNVPNSPLSPERCQALINEAFSYGRNISYLGERP